MSSFIYLYRKIWANRIKKALKRPVTYIAAAFIIFYLMLIVSSFGTLIEEFGIGKPERLAVLLSILIFFILPSNLISYSRRKGLMFKKSDIHFKFPAPVSPKLIILFTGSLNLFINLVITLVIIIMGLAYFEAAPWQILLYAVLFFLFESVLEASLMILCYGNETLPESFFKGLTVVCYCLMAVFVIVAFLMIYQRGASFSIIEEYLGLPIIQMIPVVGWNIALTRLIFIGPTTLNIVCTVLFCLSTLVLAVLAKRSRCEGEYYEDAEKFAEHYAKLKERKQKGQMTVSLGKKRSVRQAVVEYRGGGAKAIFYRQLLEYKKNRFFIFGFNTLVSLIVGIGLPILLVKTNMFAEANANRIFIVPGVMAYIIFIFSGYATKWSQELENPYTFLIPDNSFKKLWYSTKIEHIRALIDGIIMAVPASVVLELSPLQIVLNVLLYMCLMANKLYYFMLADFLVGKVLGSVGRSLFKLLMQAVAISIAIVGAVLGGIFISVEAGFAIMIVLTFLFTLAGAMIAAMAFGKMEVME